MLYTINVQHIAQLKPNPSPNHGSGQFTASSPNNMKDTSPHPHSGSARYQWVSLSFPPQLPPILFVPQAPASGDSCSRQFKLALIIKQRRERDTGTVIVLCYNAEHLFKRGKNKACFYSSARKISKPFLFLMLSCASDRDENFVTLLNEKRNNRTYTHTQIIASNKGEAEMTKQNL